jgi:hypothetical protein
MKRLYIAAMTVAGLVVLGGKPLQTWAAKFSQAAQEQPQQNDNPQNTAEARNDARNSDSPKEGDTITLPADSRISVRIADSIDSNKNHDGDLFTGIVDPSVTVHDNVVIPRGTEAHIRLADNKKGGHLKGKAQISLELVSLVVNGKKLEVESQTESKDKGALAAKGKAEKDSATHLSSATGPAGPAGAAAGPVIAVFAAPKVEVKPNSRVDFILAEPFTFEKPPVNIQPTQ